MRVWDVRKPFRPIVEKATAKQCRTASWFPNGVGVVGGPSHVSRL